MEQRVKRVVPPSGNDFSGRYSHVFAMPPRIRQTSRFPQKNYIREWRKHCHLSQDKLVDRVRERVEGFSKASLSRIENGLQPYTQETLEVLAWALGRTPADLLVRKPDCPIWSILDALESLPPQEQAQVADIIKTFKRAS